MMSTSPGIRRGRSPRRRLDTPTIRCCPRRWLLLSNPTFADAITTAIGDGWITDLNQLEKLKPLAENEDFQAAFWKAKFDAKIAFAEWLKTYSDVSLDPATIFDSHIKRI